MTTADRVASLLGFVPSDLNTIPGALLDRGLDGTEDYTPELRIPVLLAAIEVMELLLTTADTTGADHGFLVKYDRPSALARIKYMKLEAGIADDTRPLIKNAPVW